MGVKPVPRSCRPEPSWSRALSSWLRDRHLERYDQNMPAPSLGREVSENRPRPGLEANENVTLGMLGCEKNDLGHSLWRVEHTSVGRLLEMSLRAYSF